MTTKPIPAEEQRNAARAELREIRALICANPEESTIDELRRAIAEGVIHPVMQPGADSWPRLDKPAQVGNGVFGKGVSARFVVESAQRNYEFHQTPEKQAERAAAIQGTNLLIELRDRQIEELTRQRDGLLAALEQIANESTRNLGSARIIARAALARAKGGAA